MCPALAKPKSEKAKAFPRYIFFPQSNFQVESFKESFNSGALHSLLCLHQVLTKTFPKLYSALSVNFSLFSLDCPCFSREKHETILIQFLKIHAIEPPLVLIAALYSFY